MNTTFCLWEYTGVDSIYDVGKLVKDLTTYVKTQTKSQSEGWTTTEMLEMFSSNSELDPTLFVPV